MIFAHFSLSSSRGDSLDLRMSLEKSFEPALKANDHSDEEAAPVNVDESTVADWTEAEERAVKRK